MVGDFREYSHVAVSNQVAVQVVGRRNVAFRHFWLACLRVRFDRMGSRNAGTGTAVAAVAVAVAAAVAAAVHLKRLTRVVLREVRPVPSASIFFAVSCRKRSQSDSKSAASWAL